ncbi:unnamed protein product (macronuclear) [Paramecium tetraurelia]|uniref:Uncharacterized protein n=1 Tax=Paramecium tetraurelia TaxID=5888 RepID=A0DWL6_PARTE|nr:uncharacterized protein GSPATT00021076001 [Paramecium tetraurelia]CAK87433.1 unnamed protein product [Paramecium tetraurelia]|eukprot:XP_001454830.1 hypothetical protein (macronuclear) [Paramecium tetraurelia strain d4-2]
MSQYPQTQRQQRSVTNVNNVSFAGSQFSNQKQSEASLSPMKNQEFVKPKTQRVYKTQTMNSMPTMQGIPTMTGIPNAFTVQQNCVAAQPLCMNIIVVSKEEIEMPWRLECEYLQSLITELQNKQQGKSVQIVEKTITDNSRVELLESQLKELRRQNESLQYELHTSKINYEKELQRINSTFELRSAQVEDISQKESEFYLIRIKLEDQISQLESKIKQSEFQLRRSSDENVRLQQIINSRESEINSLRIQITSIQSNTNNSELARIRELETQIRYLNQEIDNVNSKLINSNNENQQLRIQIQSFDYKSDQQNNELILKLREYESRTTMLTSEIERLIYSLKQKEIELEEWKSRYQQLEMSGSSVFQEKVEYLSQEVEVWKSKFIRANHEFNRCQEEITMLQAELESFKKQRKQELTITSRVVTKQATTQNSGYKQYQQ